MQFLNCRAHALVLLLGLGLIAGCATPDLKPFASETVALGSAVSAEQAEVGAYIAKVSARAEAHDPQHERVERLKEYEARYTNNAAAIDRVLAVAVNYSNTLVDLAAAGETGSESAKALGSTLEGISSTLGVAAPAAKIPEWAAKLAQEVAQVATRVQAQQSLAEAMRAADPAIGQIAEAMNDVYGSEGPHAMMMIVKGLQTTDAGLLRDEVGTQRLAFYRGVNIKLEDFYGDLGSRLGQQKAGLCGLTRPVSADGGSPGTDRCLIGQEAQGLFAITNLLSGIEPQYQAYSKDLVASKVWLQQRAAVGPPIASAAAAWAAEHAAITTRLEKCGGMRALRQECGNLTFGNLKLFVGRVRAIAGKGESNVGQ